MWPTPLNNTVPGVSAQGVTTLRWGTDGLLQSPKPGVGYYTVTRFNEAALVDVSKLPNGVGQTATRVLIKDGSQFTLTVRDDTRMPPPQVGSTVAIVDAAGLLGNYGANGTPAVFTCTIINPSYEAAPKQAGERVIVCESLLLVENQTGSAQV